MPVAQGYLDLGRLCVDSVSIRHYAGSDLGVGTPSKFFHGLGALSLIQAYLWPSPPCMAHDCMLRASREE